MALNSIKRWLPTREQVHRNRYLQFLGDHLHDPDLWHFNRRSVARATAVGLLCAFLPMPMEMVPAAFGAILFRANLPLSVAWVWVSNPITWIPLYAPAYILGAWLIGDPWVPIEDITMAVLGQHVLALWVGCLIVGACAAIAGYYLVHGLWRLQVINLWRRRRPRRRKHAKTAKPKIAGDRRQLPPNA